MPETVTVGAGLKKPQGRKAWDDDDENYEVRFSNLSAISFQISFYLCLPLDPTRC
jgi:hypothetical protein